MKNIKIVKSYVINNIQEVPIIFNYIKYNRYNKKEKSEPEFLDSDLHQTNKYLKRLYYNKFY